MTDRRYPRPRSPPLQNLARSSLPTFGYPYTTDVYAVPTRRDTIEAPRSAIERGNAPFPIVTNTYIAKPDQLPSRHSSVSDRRRNRSSTLDNASRPTIINATPRSPAMHGPDGRPDSPLHNPHRSSDEGGEYYSIPASSGRHRSHHRPSYSATMDNADMSRGSGDGGLRVGSGREGARYPTRSKQVYPEALVRHADTVADDYGDDGYGYTNPRDLFEYDMSRGSRYAPPRRDSFDGPRPGRPTSISGYADIPPRSYDNRERGPPPTTRGLDKVSARTAPYDLQPLRVPPTEPGLRSPRREQFYEQESPRKYSSRRPVSIYQDRSRNEDYYDPRDEERRERREKAHHARRYEEGRERGERGERNDAKEHERKRDYDKDDDYDDQERRSGREKSGASKKDHERRHNDKDDHYDERKEHKIGRDAVAAGISLAATALGIGGLAKASKHDDSDDDSDERGPKDEHKRRRRREAREEKQSVDLSGRDPQERQPERQPERQIPGEKRDTLDDGSDSMDKQRATDGRPIDLSGRNPQERSSARDPREGVTESNDNRKDKTEPSKRETMSNSRESSPLAEEGIAPDRFRKDRAPTSKLPFDYKNTTDIRALRDVLNKKDEPAPAIPSKEPQRQESFERRDPQSLTSDDPSSHEDRGRHDHTDSERDARPKARVVSPPKEAKKPEETKPKGILRQPRDKFPEDPVPIREGVAPLKDARKDGVPPNARWTKISRRMVNPEALEAGKERYEAREDFVIVLRVLTKEEIQAYAIATQQIRAAREQLEEMEEREERRRRRRDRHERHTREREAQQRERGVKYEYDHEHRRHRREKDSHSESDSTPNEEPQKMIEGPKPRRPTFDFAPSSKPIIDSALREDPVRPGTYTGYVRNPPRRM